MNSALANPAQIRIEIGVWRVRKSNWQFSSGSPFKESGRSLDSG